MKIAYIISWIVCFLQLCMFILVGGVVPMLIILKQGFYLTLYAQSLSESESTGRLLLSVNRAVGILYLAAVFVGIGSLLLYKLDKKTQYRTGIACAIVMFLIVIIPKFLNIFL